VENLFKNFYKMKKFFLLILIIFSSASFAQEKDADCDKLKSGKFKYSDSVSNIVNVTRTNKLQTEVNSKTGIVTKFRIRWPGDCTYELSQIWSNNKEQRKSNRSVTQVKITVVQNNSYNYTCMCKDTTIAFKNSGTMFIISN